MSTYRAFSPIRSTLLTVIQLVELPLVAVVAGLAIFTERLDPAYLTLGLALLLLPPALRLLVAGRIVEPTMTLWPLLLLVALCGVTVYVTPTWAQTWPELVRLLVGVALCLAVVNWTNPIGGQRGDNGGRLEQVPWRIVVGVLCFLGVCAGLTTVGLLALGPVNKFLPALPIGLEQVQQWAPNGSFNPNRVAGVAVVAAPLVVTLLLGSLRPRRHSFSGWLGWFASKILSLGLSAFFGAALLLTESRGALLAFGCAILLILPGLGRRGWLLLIGLVLLGVGIFSDLRSTDLGNLFIVTDNNQTTSNITISNLFLVDRNLQGRLILWQRALHGIADAPLTGMGLGAFAVVSQQPYPNVAGFVPDPDMSHVHNLILQVGLDLGLPGLIGFATLLGMVALALVQMVRLSPKASALRTWSLALLATFIAYFVYNCFDALTLGARPALAIWVLFGLWIGGAEWVQAQAHQRVPRARSNTMSVARAGIDEAEEEEDDTVMDPVDQESWEARAWATTASSGK